MSVLDKFKDKVKGKNVTVIGIGISNRPLIRLLTEAGAVVTACDKRTREQLGEVYDELIGMGVKLSLGENYLENLAADIIFKTPGMRYDVPELLKARADGAEITSEMEAFFDICPCRIIAVTGSDGKTTTTTLISKILDESGYKTWLGGNIGSPLLAEADKIGENDIAVVELSSFQLHTMKKSPDVAVITNISPNHLDMHKDYQEYIDAKKNIMLYQNKDDLLVVNADNEVTAGIGKESRGRVRRFSRREKTEVYLDGKVIKFEDKDILNIDDIKIPGMHNVENYMAAIAATAELARHEAIVKVAKEFGGVEHRIELVRTIDGVKYYNSSIDSSPNRTINTLRVFGNNVVLIAGGKDKGIPYDEIGPAVCESVKHLVLIGATSDKIYDALKAADKDNKVAVSWAKTYEEAVEQARAAAKEGDVVLLSPASTSFDMFRNFEERGKLFKDIVNNLK